MTSGTILTGDGCRIAYRLDGPSSAPPLLLANSLGTTMDLWAPQLGRFAESYRVLRYDMRGHGQSNAPPGGYSIDRLSRDAIELIDALGIAQVRFCGVSLGGMIGQWLGWRAPERVQQLVLANTSAHMGPPRGWDDRIAAVRANGVQVLADAVVERWFTPAFRDAEPEIVASIRAMLLATDPQGYAGCCAAIRDMDQRRTVALIAAPTLVVGGTLDPATPPEHAKALVASIPTAQLTMLEAAHLANVEQAEAFTAAVIKFLA